MVEISTKEIKSNGSLSNTAQVFKVPLTELDIIRIGSVWEGQRKTGRNWQRLKHEQFSFDFTIDAPEVITFSSKDPLTSNYFIPSSQYWLGDMGKVATYHFLNSTLTKLRTISGATILIPGLEFLTSAVVPYHKQFRSHLLHYNLPDFLELHVKKAKEEDVRYVIESRENHLSENMTLLAYLKLNKASFQRLSRLWASVQRTRAMPNGRPYEDRYPEVLPFHPTSMALSGRGLWVDNQTFLILRITGVSQPQDFKVECLETEYRTNDPERTDSSPKGLKNPRIIDQEDLGVDGMNDPGIKTGRAFIRSEVKLLGPTAPVTRSTAIKEIEGMPPANHEGYEEVTGLSSGDPTNRKDSEGIAQLKQSKAPADLSGLLSKTVDALTEMVKDVDSQVSDFHFVGNDGTESHGSSYCTIRKKQLDKNIKGRWHLHRYKNLNKTLYTYRHFLLVKIYLEDGKSAYLLEIERTQKSDAFAGLLFSAMSNNITADEIVRLLQKVVQHKGRFHAVAKSVEAGGKIQIRKLELPVYKSYVFRHKDIYNSLKNAIKKAYQSHIFC
ncbi:hypothetical protein LOH54_01130 [Sulfurimonas sp. HSL-3221]|uniref:hypothetical protein n=1 Tax=Sulfurimonadaceae TaxID=2771471 RepID=UPI001E4D334F|nr:hypothetical protein [Sulfurimonas sp. HSL-3221]UFS62744.1 hypothetical protein LOH54_01130 [Sulfurimonas sp. HSL-3221]